MATIDNSESEEKSILNDIHNVCRLCARNNDNLVSVFDRYLKCYEVTDSQLATMREAIYVICNVKITQEDEISQYVCMKCCTIALKTFKFRKRALLNQEQLKIKLAEYKVKKLNKSSSALHPSVMKMVKENPSIKFPELEPADYLPSITLMTDEVDEWFESKNCSPEEIAEMKRAALLANLRISKEKNTCVTKRKRSTSTMSSKSDVSTTKRKLSISSNSDLSCDSTVSKKKKSEEKQNDENISNKNEESSNSNTNNNIESNISKLGFSIRPVKPKQIQTQDLPKDNEQEVKKIVKPKFRERQMPVAQTESTSNPPTSEISADVSSKDLKDTKSAQQPNCKVKIHSVHTLTPKKMTSTDAVKLPQSRTIYSEKKVSELQKEMSKNKQTVKEAPKTQTQEKPKESESSKLIVQQRQKQILGETKQRPSSSLSLKDLLMDSEPVPEKKTKSKETQQTAKPLKSTDTQMVNIVTSAITEPYKLLYRIKNNEVERIVVEKENGSVEAVIPDSTNNESDDNDSIAEQISNRDDLSDDENDSSKSSCSGNDKISEKAFSNEKSANSELDLVQVKSYKVYRCNICDIIFYNSKNLRSHERRAHTKCQFCGQRFSNSVEKNEHIVKYCLKHVTMKKPKLELIRVNEQPELVKKYPQLLDVSKFVNNKFGNEKGLDKNKQPSSKNNENVILNYLLDLPSEVKDQPSSMIISKDDDDVVIIQNSTNKKTITPNIKVRDIPFLTENIQYPPDDISKIKYVVQKLTKKDAETPDKAPHMVITQTSERCFVLRNLKTELSKYRIPVDISHGDKLQIGIVSRNENTEVKKRDFWRELIPTDLPHSLLDTTNPNSTILKTKLEESKNKSPVVMQAGSSTVPIQMPQQPMNNLSTASIVIPNHILNNSLKQQGTNNLILLSNGNSLPPPLYYNLVISKPFTQANPVPSTIPIIQSVQTVTDTTAISGDSTAVKTVSSSTTRPEPKIRVKSLSDLS